MPGPTPPAPGGASPYPELIQYFVNMGMTPEVAVKLASKVAVMEPPTPPIANGIKLEPGKANMTVDPDLGAALDQLHKSYPSYLGGMVNNAISAGPAAVQSITDSQDYPEGVPPGAGGPFKQPPPSQHIVMQATPPPGQHVYMNAKIPEGAHVTMAARRKDPITGEVFQYNPNTGKEEFLHWEQPDIKVTDTEGYSQRVGADPDLQRYRAYDIEKKVYDYENPEGYSQHNGAPDPAYSTKLSRRPKPTEDK